MVAKPLVAVACRTLLAAASSLVPAEQRAHWRCEWEAELEHAWSSLSQGDPISFHAKLRLVARCFVSFRDALVVRHLTRPASASIREPRAARCRTAVSGLLQDIRLAARRARRAPGFTAVVVLTIALGIGATTAIFSVVDGVLLNPLPHEDADRLVVLWETDTRTTPPGTRNNVTAGNFADWRELNRVFEGIAAYSLGQAALTGLAQPEMVNRAWVTSNFLPLLRARAAVGRAFVTGEDTPDAANLVVLSHDFWQRRYGADPSVIGTALTLNGDSYLMVGVLQPGVDFLARGIQVWTPYRLGPSDFEDRRSHQLNVLARLKPGITLEQAQAEMDAIADRIRMEYPEWMTGRGVNVLPLLDELAGRVRPALLILLGGVLIVLLIAVVNVANLLLVRATGRRREFAVQIALGAGRGRLLARSLTESLTMSVAGGALGLALAAGGANALLALAPGTLPRADEVGVNLRVLAFAFGLSCCTGILVGLLSTLDGPGAGVSDALREGSRSASAGERRGLRRALVVVELALSMVLLIGAGLLSQTFWRLLSVDPGFSSERVLTAQLRLPVSEYADAASVNAFHEGLLSAVRALPQVRSAGLTRFLPLSDGSWTFSFAVEGQPPAAEGEKRDYAYHPISTDYFKTVGIGLLRGRDFTEADNADAPPVLIIDEAMKQRFWPNEDPIGERIRFVQDSDGGPWREIVGIVNSVRHDGLRMDPRPTLYGPQSQAFYVLLDRMRLVVRTASDPLQIVRAVRDIVCRLDPNLPLVDVRTMDQVVATSLAQPRFSWLLLGSFAGAAVVLALIGIYGVVSYSARQRLPELGLRVALGASPGGIVAFMLMQGMVLVSAGIAVGIAAALVCSRVLGSLLFGVSAIDPVTYGTLAIVLAAAAALACYVPARRASRVDPMVVLRSE